MKSKSNWNTFPYKRVLFILLLPISFLLTIVAKKNPLLTERIYTQKIYVFLRAIFARLSSLVNFSVAELFIVVFIITIGIWIIVTIIKLVTSKEKRKHQFLSFVSTCLAIACILSFFFTIFCGINYYRPSYSQLTGLDPQPAPVEELEALCLDLIDTANRQRNDSLEMDGIYQLEDPNYKNLALQAQEEYNQIGKVDPLFGGYTPKPKPVKNSIVMSYLNITGVYFPFTFEANFNTHSTPHMIPATILHELAHSKGFMQESDANFIAYAISRESSRLDFNYSGTLLALIHSTNAYYKAAGTEKYVELMQNLSPGVLRDLQADIEYWKQFETPVAEISNKVNDNYLKSNNQKSGIASYGQMVDLLLADYRQRMHDKNTELPK